MKSPALSKGQSFARTLLFLFKLIILFVFLILFNSRGNAQCQAAPAMMSCNPAGATALANNDAIVAGQIKTVNSAASLGNLAMSGGTLVVCANLTLSNISWSGGVIYINSGCTLQINTASAIVFGSNCSLYNYGTFSCTGSIVTGQNNIIYNCSPSAAFNLIFNQFVIQGPNTYIINKGLINCAYVIVQSTNATNPICSDFNSVISTNIMINQFANAFTSPNGPSCIYIAQTIINSQPMSATPDVDICYKASSVSIIGAPNFGSATVNSNCTSCSIVLPLEITGFHGSCNGTSFLLDWTCTTENMGNYFLVEESKDGVLFQTAGSTKANGNPGMKTTYTYNYEPSAGVNGIFYFRIAQVDAAGKKDYSPAIAVSCEKESGFELYPSLIESNPFFIHAKHGLESVRVFELSGKLIFERLDLSRELNVIELPGNISRGLYIVTVTETDGKVHHVKVNVI